MSFKLTDARNSGDVERLAAEDTLTGMVINEIDGLGSEERKLLESSYPGVDFKQVLIFEPGRKPMSTGAVYGMLGGGILLILAGIAWLVKGKKSRT